MKIIDFRLRPPLRSFLKCDFWNQTKNPFEWHSEPPASIQERSWDLLRKELAECGVSRAVVWGRTIHDPAGSSSNDDIAWILREHGDLFIAGFGGICPSTETVSDTIREVERCMLTLGFKGVTLEPSLGMRPLTFADDPILYPIYERLQELGGILALTISRGSPPMQTLRHSNPEAVDRVAGDFPRLKIVISHAFWPWVEASCGLAFRRPNVYLHPDLYGTVFPGYRDWIDAANSFLSDRLIFGSAYPYMGVPTMVKSYLGHPYRPGVLEKVMYRNALALLGMDDA